MHSLGKAERYTVHKAWDLNPACKGVQGTRIILLGLYSDLS
jgi:hypothetical protein